MTIRPRRLRVSETMRRMVQETRLSVSDFIYPMFVVHGSGIREEVPSMPGVYRFSVDELCKEALEVRDVGIPGILLFGLPETKDELGSEAYAPQGIVQKAVRALKSSTENLLVITDACLCEYTSHGHCGVLENGCVLNEPTLELLAKTAVSHAEAGADIIAPSDMMDFRVAAIRGALDAQGFDNTAIMSYAAKYCSAFYGPFRDAADSAPKSGDRKAYQMDPANVREALKEVALDISECADIVMVKPALSYLDVIHRVKADTDVPVAAYNVSGEYSMVKAAAGNGWIDEQRVTMEILTSIKRAGADIIISYHAKDVAQWIG
ncbi:MAG TPA: porphobilinogen synthase [Armatimonadota bacterium]